MSASYVQSKFLIILVLVLHVSLLMYNIVIHSPTNGEIPALSSGVYHLSTGRFDLFRVNPPLVRCIAATPVLMMHPKTDWSHHKDIVIGRDEFPVGIQFTEINGKNSFFYFTLARIACIPFSLLGIWVCYRWGNEIYGYPAGMMSLILWCFSPTVLGHAATIGPDLPSAACGLFSCYCFWNWLKKPTWNQAFFTGIALGLAELTKATWIILFPIWFVIALIWFIKLNVKKVLLHFVKLISIFILALLCINLVYGFERFGTRLGEFRFISRTLGGKTTHETVSGNIFQGTGLHNFPVPLPANYVVGIDIQKSDFEFKSDNYLNGTWQYGGWWYYYVFALLIKEPVGTLFLFFLAVFVTIKGRLEKWKDEIVLLLPVICVFILVSSQTGMNHHYRYIIPVLPFLFIWIGKVAQYYLKTVILLLLLVIVSSLINYPHSLSYFNEFIGGPKNGPKYLLGSNVDWGQDILLLKKWCDKHPEAKPFYLKSASYFDPAVAGIDYQNLSTNAPQPGWYALSVNYIYGRSQQYRYFLNYEPVDKIGYSIYVYHITPEEANRVRREMGLSEIDEQPSATADNPKTPSPIGDRYHENQNHNSPSLHAH